MKQWRLTQSLTLSNCAEALGCKGARTYQRYEDGMHRADAPLVEAIVTLTGGAVTAQDMHETRLEWLQARGRGGVSMPARLAEAGGGVCQRKPENLGRHRE